MSRKKSISVPPPPCLSSLTRVISMVTPPINMRSLTVAIRQHCIEYGLYHEKEALLNFFLQCEKQLKSQHVQEWNRVIHHQTSLLKGIVRMQATIGTSVQRSFIQQLKSHQVNDFEATGMDMDFTQELEELGVLQISEDIKLKTKFFYKWCKFLQARREIRRLKDQQIEHLKVAKTFCQHNLKALPFTHWKLFTQNRKVIRQKADRLQVKTHELVANRVMSQIKETIQILAIERSLSEVVLQRMQFLRKRVAVCRLKVNKEECKQALSQYQTQDNIWVHRLEQWMGRRVEAVQTPFIAKIRQLRGQHYQHLILKLSWKGLKTMTLVTQRKQQRIRSKLMMTNMAKLVKLHRQMKKIRQARGSLESLRKQWGLRIFYEEATQDSRKQVICSEKVQIIKNNLTEHSLTRALKSLKAACTSRVSLRRKKQETEQFLLINKIKNIFKKMVSRRSSILKNKNNIRLIKQKWMMNLLMKRFSNYQRLRKERKQMKNKLDGYHSRYLKKVTLRSFKLYEDVAQTQSQILTNFYEIINHHLLLSGFAQIKHYSSSVNNLHSLVDVSTKNVLKYAFRAIMNQMLNKQIRVQQFNIKKENRLKGLLFELLIRNSQYMRQRQEEIAMVQVKYSKKEFFRNLKKNLIESCKMEAVSYMDEAIKKQMALGYMKASVKAQRTIDQRIKECKEMRRVVAVDLFFQSSCDFVEYRQEELKKQYKIHRIMARKALQQIHRHMEHKKKRLQLAKNREDFIEGLAQGIIDQRLGKCLQILVKRNPLSLKRKVHEVEVQRKTNFFGLLRFNHKEQTFIKLRAESVQLSTLNHLLEFQRMVTQKRQASILYQSSRCHWAISRMFNNCIQDITDRDQKQEQVSSMLRERRSQNGKAGLINQLAYEAQFSENQAILANCIARRGIKEFFKANNSLRSQNIKELIALRHYAHRLRKKGLRGLRKQIQLCILKENRIRSEYNSKMRMERSIDHARKKSKLVETIERYNLSRVTKFCR